MSGGIYIIPYYLGKLSGQSLEVINCTSTRLEVNTSCLLPINSYSSFILYSSPFVFSFFFFLFSFFLFDLFIFPIDSSSASSFPIWILFPIYTGRFFCRLLVVHSPSLSCRDGYV